jgi:guanylate kinase
MRNYRFTAIIDVDDVLLPCMSLACQLENEKNPEANLDPDKIKGWIKSDSPEASLLKYFNDPDFYAQQIPDEAAKKFIRELSKLLEIFVVTAVPSEIMGIRIRQILEFFPEIKPENIIPATRKDVIFADFALDDGAHNILASRATYPVIFRRSWNNHLTGILAVNNYDEFINLVRCIQKTYYVMDDDFTTPHVLAFVGGSGTGKTRITTELLKGDKFGRARSTTTRRKRLGEADEAYNFISEDKFNQMKADGLFAETTIYAEEQYGTECTEIEKVLNSGKHCVAAIDINGAMAMKMKYPTAIIYIKRDKDKLIDALIERVEKGETTRHDVVRRIVSLDDEKKNEKICDYFIENNGSIEQTIADVYTILGLE